MMPLTFGEVERWTRGTALKCPLDRPVTRLTIDSREVGPDALFFALPGTRTDGHAFVEEVWKAGGVALVKDDFPSAAGPQIRVASPLKAMGQLLRNYIEAYHVTVVGVTGSVGKTSVKELSAAVLTARYQPAWSLGNYNTNIGLPLSFFQGQAGTTHFVAEMGMSAPGEIHELTQIAPPQVAVISTIGPSHLERLGSMEAIQHAKGEILEGLKDDGLAVLNHDNHWVRELGEQTPKRVEWFGTFEGASARVMSAVVTQDRTRIELLVHGRPLTIDLPWLGVHHAHNVAASLLVGLELGVPLSEARDQLEAIEAGRSRIRVIDAGQFTILEDVYNASPLSTGAALDVLASRGGRRMAVVGDMLELGQEEVPGHQQVGRYAASRTDLLLCVGERARHTYEAARAAGVAAAWTATRQDALDWLTQRLAPGDTVLLKASRGMQFEWLSRQLAAWGDAQ